jgi:triacylglycerol lipase
MRRLVLVLALAALLAAAMVPATPAAARAAARPTRDPVLLVHGFNGSGASWHIMKDRLLQAGYPVRAIDAMSYDSERSNVDIAKQIEAEVDALLARTGATKVDVIAHSMGAISARFYVEHLGGEGKVDAFVSLGGVNRGTYWAVGCAVLVSCREMVPGSSLLDELAPNVQSDLPTRFAAWWSPCDPAILPPTNAELPGAVNTETGCLGHSDLKTDGRVVSEVLAFVARPHLRTIAA